jgi:RNA polymerase sigma-70 factor (sigma-E family)
MVAIELTEMVGLRLSKPDLEELYRRHSVSGYRLALLLTGDPELAADLLQDAFVRLLGSFHDLRDPSAFPAYLRRTLINLSRSYFRRRRIERSHLHRSRELPPSAVTDLGAREEMTHWLANLPSRQRAAVVLRFYEDLSEKEAAEALQTSVPALKSLVQRGLSSLREEVERERR